MTDNEIIQALEWHLNDETHCSACPYEEHSVTHFCVEMVISDALDIINSQKAEIEGKDGIILKQKEMIERTQKLVDDTDKNCRTAINIIARYERQFKSIKAEAVKEFAERLKTKKHECGCNFKKKPVFAVTEEKIDETYKEMVGEG